MKYSYLVLIIILFSCSKEQPFSLDGIALDKNDISIQIDEEATLTVTNFDPPNPEDYTIEWISSDSSIVAVENGIVRGSSLGVAYVHAKIGEKRTTSSMITVSGVLDEDNDVYVTGSVGGVVTYWKNGNAVALTDGEYDAESRSIFIDGEDVYVAGHEETPTGKPNAKYWKNGEDLLLSEKQSYSVEIIVVGEDVYVAGNELTEDGSGYAAVVWKNGIVTELSSQAEFTIATAMYVDNGDVYVSGYSFVTGIDGTLSVPKYWINGEETILTPVRPSHVNDIHVSDGALYIVGSEFEDDLSYAKYWKDNTEVVFPSSGTNAYATSMALDGSDVYASGFVDDQNLGYHVATYWKNGEETILSQNEMEGEECDIAIANGHVYILINEYNSEGFHISKYWKNEREIIFVDRSVNSHVRDIKLVPK